MRLAIALWKSPNKMFDLFKDIQNSLFHLNQCWAKPEKRMLCDADQEGATKLTLHKNEIFLQGFLQSDLVTFTEEIYNEKLHFLYSYTINIA